MLAMAVPAYTQAVSSSMRGDVVAQDGAPVDGATVEIIDTRTNATSRQSATGGSFNASGLDVGGPYKVRVTAPGYRTREIDGVFLQLGETYRTRITMESEASTEKVTVTGKRNAKLDKRGVGAAYDDENIRDMPTTSRDFKDIVSQSPLVYQDSGTVIGGTVQNPLTIAGQNPRCNSFTVDGLPVNDSFGLNFNGYPTSRGPLPIDWAKQVQVAAAPYNTEYNDFCGGIVNVVTRTGENEPHGSLYYYFADQDLAGRKTGDFAFNKSEYREENFGATASGAIIPDHLFFFLGYDRIIRVTPVSIGAGEGLPAGTFSTQVRGITEAEVDEVTNIAQTVYGFNPGQLTDAFKEDNKRWIGKLNWQINDNHRAQVTYSEADGGTLSTRASSSSTLPILGLPSNWYLDAEELTSYSGQVFSNWTDNFSTEFRVGRSEVHGDQAPTGGADFAEVYVRTDGEDDIAGNGDDGYIVIGPDQFRHFNVLDYQFDIIKLTGTYQVDRHVVKGGYERKMLDIFNGFVQGSDGIYRFDSIADFQVGIVASTLDTRLGAGRGREPIRYANAPDNSELTASATWGYNIDSFYAQDDWDINDNLSVMLGARFDSFSSEGVIEENPGFVTAYGFSNTKDLGGLTVLLPRGSFSYTIDGEEYEDPTFTVRGGFGRFSGGSPNVWLSNNFSNNGLGYVQIQGLAGGAVPGGNLPTADFLGQAPVNFNLFDVPDVLQDLLSLQSGNGPVNALAPNFQIPSTWRMSAAVDSVWDGWLFSLEYMHLISQDQLFWKDLRSVDTGARTLADNRIIYGANPLRPSDGGRDLILANTDQGKAKFIIANTEKEWDDADLGRIKLRAGYTYSDVQDIGYGTASTADSNFQQRAFVNLNEPHLGRSDYEREHRFTANASWAHRFFSNLETRIGFFGQHMSGQPYSYVFSNNPFGGNGNSFRNLLYVPQTDASGNVTLASDPNVNYAPGFNITGFNDFLKHSGLIEYAGGIAPRNEFFSDWTTRVDMNIEQEINIFGDHRVVLEFDLFNLGNLINKDWGQFSNPNFYPTQGVVSAAVGGGACASAAGVYCYSGTIGTAGSIDQVRYPQSVWQAQVGIRYEF